MGKGIPSKIVIHDPFNIGDPLKGTLKSIRYKSSLFKKEPYWFMEVNELPGLVNDTIITYTNEDGKRAVSRNNAWKGSDKDPSFDVVKKLFQTAWKNSTKK